MRRTIEKMEIIIITKSTIPLLNKAIVDEVLFKAVIIVDAF
jgi:hypothetical protein